MDHCSVGYYISCYGRYLSENEIEELPSGIFKGLRNLLLINLFDNKIRSVSLEHFKDVTRLRFLFLHYNKMYDLPKGIFTNMSNITRVTLDTNLMCCHLEFKQDAACDFAYNDNFANCESMFSRYLAPRKSIWVVGILSLFGAVFVLAWRLFFKSTNVVQAIMLIHLALADGLMGVYLITIAVKDLLWHGEYYLHDYEWRTGLACQITGAISILSGEVSVMLLLLIAADRMTKIVFPFHCRGLTRKITHVLCLVIWLIGAIIAFLPMLGMQFFKDPESHITYYGRSVVCIPLQLTSYSPPGWEYSVAVFVGLNLAFVVFIVLAYLIIFINRREVRSRSANTSRETSLDKRVLCIVFTNCASWLPIIVVGIRSMVHRSDELPEELSVWMAVFVLPINAAINPVLYTLTTPQVQEILEQKWQQLWSYLMNKFGAPQNHEDEGEVDPDQIVEMEAFDPSGDEDGDGVDNQNQLPHIGPLGVSGGEEGRTQEQYNNRKEDESSDPGPPKAPLATFDEVDDLEDWETPV